MRIAKLLGATALLAIAGTNSAWADECGGNRAAGTVLGAIAGGVIGGAVSHGNGGAVVGGVILGGLAGNAIAGDIDCDSRPYAYRVYRHALDEGEIGEHYEWEHHGRHGYIVITRDYWDRDRRCRDFTVVTWRYGDDYSHSHDGSACRYEDDDNWHFM